MSDWLLTSDRVQVGVNRHGGQLGPARFRTGGRWLEPMHRAPWLGQVNAAPEPMLQNLQGDFFCAPFGANDLLPEEKRAHGLTANGDWRLLAADDSRLLLELDGVVSGASVTKEVYLRAGHPVVYQVHRFEGGSGRIPMGHHAMLRVPEGDTLRLSFSRFVWAGTRPQPPETDPRRGRSKLEYPQRLTSLEAVRTSSGAPVDVSRYPAVEDSEDLVMLVTDPALDLAWSAAVAPRSGWIWFALRPNDVLRNTLLWMSNGGRDYPPFSGRHRRVIGIEEVTSYFDLGHVASTEPNELSQMGFPTAVDLQPDGVLTTCYAFGAVPAPAGFELVEAIHLSDGEVVISDADGREVRAPMEPGFLGL